VKNFFWNYFFNTGQIDAYLSVKEYENILENQLNHQNVARQETNGNA